MRRLLLLALAFALVRTALADGGDGPKKEDAAPRLNELTTYQLLPKVEKSLDKAAKSDPSGKTVKLLGMVSAVRAQADAAEKKQPGAGQKTAAAALDESINAPAADIKPEDVPAEVYHDVNIAAARLNNSAGESSAAETFASRQLMADPDARDAYIERATARVGLERYDAALADAQKAVALNPSGADGYRARAMAEFGMHNYLQASEDARRALALDPDDRVSHAIMKLVEGRVPKVDIDKLRTRMAGEIMGEYHGMLQQLNEADARRQADSGGRLWPNAASGSERYQTPSGRASAAGAAGPTAAAEAATALVQDAAARVVGKDYTGALAQADKALERDPKNLAAYFYRSTADNLLGRYEEAAQDATRALQVDPADAPSHDARAYAYNHLGRYRDAVADSNHSLEINPQNAYAYANLGYSHEHMGELMTMLGDLKTAATLNPQFEPAYRDAASRHGLAYEPLTDDGLAQQESERTSREQQRRKQFLFVIGSSLLGGLLIALGFLQLFGPSGAPAGATAAAKVAPAKPATGPGPAPTLASFSLGRQVGLGGMGVVYEGFDRALERRVAIKAVRDELKSDDAARQRFLAEARTVAALHHPGIVDIHTIVEQGDDIYLVFEFVEGKTVADLVAERGRLPLREAKPIIAQVCRALDFAHRRGVIHRDLKPANIMVATDGIVKLMDFGISRPADAFGAHSLTAAESRTGTPDYMAPEQRYGAVRPESDVFSLGACLYEMTTGRRPFPASQAIPAGEFTKASALAPELPPALDGFFAAALHPDPERRIRSARDFWALLERIKEPVAA